MTTNFQLFKEKLEKSKAKKATSNFTWMKLDSGKRYTLRFIPLKSEDFELPIAIYNHHALNFPDGHFESVACPRLTEERDCPFCTFASQQYKKYTKTDNRDYLDAFKKLVAKRHYLLVGYEPSEIDTSDIKPEDLKIVRASSQANMQSIESKLEKEIDFVDPQTGRNVELKKIKGTGKDAITTIIWDYQDPEPAFTGKNASKIWQDILDKSPDLTTIITPMSDADLAKKFSEFTATPVDTDESEETPEEEEQRLVEKYKAPVKTKEIAVETADDGEIDIEQMRKMLADD